MAKSSKTFVVDGIEMSLSEISKKFKINYATLRARSLKGLTGSDLISKSQKKAKQKKTPIKVKTVKSENDRREVISFDKFVDEIEHERKQLLQKI